MGAIVMNSSEQRIYKLAMEVLHDRLSLKEFSLLIGKSYRQSQRIIGKIQDLDMLGIKHGNIGKLPANKTEIDLKNFVVGLYRTKFFDFNVTHFREKLIEEEGLKIGRETLRKWARENGLVKCAKRRHLRRVHKPRPRMPKRGMLIQFDGSEHDWFSGHGPFCTLIGGIDDATGEVVGLEFFESENAMACLKSLRDIVAKHGEPDAFYMDQGSCFGKTYRDQDHTQVGRALEDLGIKIILASTPQAKGKIERLWLTLQDRLTAELRLRGLSNLSDANKFLHDIYIEEHNRKFSISPRMSEKSFKRTRSADELENVFCVKESRKIGNGNVFSYEVDKYIITENQNLRFRTVHIRKHTNGTLSFEVFGKKVSANRYYGKNEWGELKLQAS